MNYSMRAKIPFNGWTIKRTGRNMKTNAAHRNARNIEEGRLESFEGIIQHYGEYGSEIIFDCLICNKRIKINLKGENSKTEHCGIIYNKKFRYGREIFPTLKATQSN